MAAPAAVPGGRQHARRLVGCSRQVFCIFMMCTAACVFGLILGQLQEIFAVANMRDRGLEDLMESVLTFLGENKIPAGLSRQVMAWMRFQYPIHRADTETKDLMELLPPSLRQPVSALMNKRLFSQVELLRVLREEIRNDLTAEVSIFVFKGDECRKEAVKRKLLLHVKSELFSEGSIIAKAGDEADRLCIVESSLVNLSESILGQVLGRVSMRLPGGISTLCRLGPGSNFGGDSLFGDTRWAGMFGIEADFVAEENCKLIYVPTDKIMELVHARFKYAELHSLISSFTGFADIQSPTVCVEEANKESLLIFQWIRASRQLLRLCRRRESAAGKTYLQVPTFFSLSAGSKQGKSSMSNSFNSGSSKKNAGKNNDGEIALMDNSVQGGLGHVEARHDQEAVVCSLPAQEFGFASQTDASNSSYGHSITSGAPGAGNQGIIGMREENGDSASGYNRCISGSSFTDISRVLPLPPGNENPRR